MDRTWTNFSRASNEYQNGVQSFLDFAFYNSIQENMILCPCKKCGNIYWHYREVVYEHLIVDGFIRGGYRQDVREDDMESMMRDAFNMQSEGFQSFSPNYVASDDYNIGGNTFMETRISVPDEQPNEEVAKFYTLLGKMPRRRLRDLSIVQNTTNSEEVSIEQQTVVGSSNVPETLDESVEFQTENGGTRRGRGRTLLTDLYNLNSVERVKVTRNSHGQPVGQEARLLAGYLGIIARNANMLPINYESWHNMPDSNKNQALSNIKERFALEVSDAYIKKALGKKWRDHKSILKKEYFKKPISLEEKLQNVPPGMLRYQWEDAVRFWNSKKGEDRERVGKAAGKNKNLRTRQGREEKDGTPMTSEAAEIMEKLKDKKAEYEATASTDSSVNFEDIDNIIINEVLGSEKYGRVRFQGSGVNPTQYFGSTSHQYMPSGSQSQAEVQRLKDQIVQIQASTDEQISQLKAEAAAREAEAAAREAEQNRKYNELQLQFRSMMTMF
ncbi:hypothetical protein GOBAR_AA14781 [Gossypium barbadense]|uniref:Transposase-associated domain-containing protein n=1 Tax=Gossypium barbadense TaxID=3634 RepID=A0A2P5XR77_GOSBA|nr:hypothetical protein GOBAR_AA14781 [Gossypium barbadense]